MPVDPYQSAKFGYAIGEALHGTCIEPDPIPVSADLTKGDRNFEGDPLFFETGDGGDLEFREGEPRRSGNLCNASYLSMFGGNVEDTGLPDDKKQAWINYLSDNPSQHYRGQTQRQLNELPMTSANVPVLEATVVEDHAWMLADGVTTSVAATVTIVGPKRAKISVDIEALGEVQTFVHFANWKAES
jgi:hypothetical protein